MREGKVTIEGKQYYVTYSLSVILAMREKGFGSADGSKMDQTIEATITLLHECMLAGYKWAQARGREPLAPPTLEDLALSIDVADLGRIMHELQPVITGERNVIAKAPKKAEAETSEDQRPS